MKIEKIELPETLTEKTACEFVGRIAAVCSGKYPKSNEAAERIGRMNLTEDFDNQPTRAWEFLPVFGDSDYCNFRGNIKNDKEYYTLKEMCKLYNNQYWLIDYHIFKLTVPKFVRDHIKTHTTLSTLASSKRLGANNEIEYWFPEPEIKQNPIIGTDRINLGVIDENKALCTNDGEMFYEDYTGWEFTEMLERFYTRKEIQKRSLSDFEVVEMMCAGDENAWKNFINVRTVTCDGGDICPNPKCEKPCIQKETRWVAEQIRAEINKKD